MADREVYFYLVSKLLARQCMSFVSTIVISKSCSSVGYLIPNTWDGCFYQSGHFFACEDFNWHKVGVVFTDNSGSR